MGLKFWTFVALFSGLAHLILFMADREVSAGVERLSEIRLTHRHFLNADPNLKLVSARSPYMRSER